ncbi:MAG: YifB family Mg chelatase-like AAA ATPase, partial [Myxococcota bacterium]
ARARERQRARAGALNAALPDRKLVPRIDATPEARALLGRAVEKLALSARAARRTLKVARTVADLEGLAEVTPAAVAEALGYRDGGPPS